MRAVDNFLKKNLMGKTEIGISRGRVGGNVECSLEGSSANEF